MRSALRGLLLFYQGIQHFGNKLLFRSGHQARIKEVKSWVGPSQVIERK